MAGRVKVMVLRTAGTNCNEETAFAFSRCGGLVEQVHINALIEGIKKLDDYHILALPGGFSYGDDISSGRILANQLRLQLGQDIKKFIDDGKLIIGICNGFQVLVKAGILPGLGLHRGQEATLFDNDSGRFEDRWVHVRSEGSCVWTKGCPREIFLPVAHGEGKFIPKDAKVLEVLVKRRQVVFRYSSSDGMGPVGYPANPNGSLENIAGICDRTGRVLGLMPHPERHFLFEQHPFWTRLPKKSGFGDGAKIFENGVAYVRDVLLKQEGG